jgi:hypothetical protein
MDSEKRKAGMAIHTFEDGRSTTFNGELFIVQMEYSLVGDLPGTPPRKQTIPLVISNTRKSVFKPLFGYRKHSFHVETCGVNRRIPWLRMKKIYGGDPWNALKLNAVETVIADMNSDYSYTPQEHLILCGVPKFYRLSKATLNDSPRDIKHT